MFTPSHHGETPGSFQIGDYKSLSGRSVQTRKLALPDLLTPLPKKYLQFRDFYGVDLKRINTGTILCALRSPVVGMGIGSPLSSLDLFQIYSHFPKFFYNALSRI